MSPIDAIAGARAEIKFNHLRFLDLVEMKVVPDPEPYDVSYVDTWSNISSKQRKKIKREIIDECDDVGVC